MMLTRALGRPDRVYQQDECETFRTIDLNERGSNSSSTLGAEREVRNGLGHPESTIKPTRSYQARR